MRSVRGAAGVLLAAAVALGGLPAAASADTAAKRKRTCTPKRTKTIAQNEHVRVYRTRSRRYYGCAFKTRRRFRLPSVELGADGYGPFALRGKFVAFGFYPACGLCSDEDNQVEVWDAVRRRGRTISLDETDDGKVTRVNDIEVTGRGAAGWISRDMRTPTDRRVQKVEPGDTTPTLLDSGPEIALGSLARSGPYLYWTKAGAASSSFIGL